MRYFECALIKHFGTLIHRTGPLTNLNNGSANVDNSPSLNSKQFRELALELVNRADRLLNQRTCALVIQPISHFERIMDDHCRARLPNYSRDLHFFPIQELAIDYWNKSFRTFHSFGSDSQVLLYKEAFASNPFMGKPGLKSRFPEKSEKEITQVGVHRSDWLLIEKELSRLLF